MDTFIVGMIILFVFFVFTKHKAMNTIKLTMFCLFFFDYTNTASTLTQKQILNHYRPLFHLFLPEIDRKTIGYVVETIEDMTVKK